MEGPERHAHPVHNSYLYDQPEDLSNLKAVYKFEEVPTQEWEACMRVGFWQSRMAALGHDAGAVEEIFKWVMRLGVLASPVTERANVVIDVHTQQEAEINKQALMQGVDWANECYRLAWQQRQIAAAARETERAAIKDIIEGE